jgi:hypothetical protein
MRCRLVLAVTPARLCTGWFATGPFATSYAAYRHALTTAAPVSFIAPNEPQGCNKVAMATVPETFVSRRTDFLKRCQSFQWCPGAESNHRHCDFQSRTPLLSKALTVRRFSYVRIKTLIISSIFVDATRHRTHNRRHSSELIVRTQRGHEHEAGKPERGDD